MADRLSQDQLDSLCGGSSSCRRKLVGVDGNPTISNLEDVVLPDGRVPSANLLVAQAASLFGLAKSLDRAMVDEPAEVRAVFTRFQNRAAFAGHFKDLQRLTIATYNTQAGTQLVSKGMNKDLFTNEGRLTADGAVRFLAVIDRAGGFRASNGGIFDQQTLDTIRSALEGIASAGGLEPAPPPWAPTTLTGGGLGTSEFTTLEMPPVANFRSPLLESMVVRGQDDTGRDLYTLPSAVDGIDPLASLQAAGLVGDITTSHPAVTDEIRNLEGLMPLGDNNQRHFYHAVRAALPNENVVLLTKSETTDNNERVSVGTLVMIENEDGQLQPVNPPVIDSEDWIDLEAMGFGHLEAAGKYISAGWNGLRGFFGNEEASEQASVQLTEANRIAQETTNDLIYKERHRLASAGGGLLAAGMVVAGAPLWATGLVVAGAAGGAWYLYNRRVNRGHELGLHDEPQTPWAIDTKQDVRTLTGIGFDTLGQALSGGLVRGLGGYAFSGVKGVGSAVWGGVKFVGRNLTGITLAGAAGLGAWLYLNRDQSNDNE